MRTSWCGGGVLADAAGFAFDLDGTLVRRTPDGPEPLPGARDVLDAIRRSGRPLAVFTNASHATPAELADRVRAAGLPVDDRDVLTPVCSAIAELHASHARRPVCAFATSSTRARLRTEGIDVLRDDDDRCPEVVFVAHVDEVDLRALEAAAHAVRGGSAFLTANIAAVYAGADGPIVSRGAMVTAAIAHAAQTPAVVVGKPSSAALRALVVRLGVRSDRIAVVGDDLDMDIALGHLGGSRTILVRTGLSGDRDVAAAPAELRPHVVLDDVGGLLGLP